MQPEISKPVEADSATSVDRAEKLKAFSDLLELRMFSASPGLITYLIDGGVVGDAIEYGFWQLPNEIVDGVRQIIGCAEVEILKYFQNNTPCTGFRIKPSDEDLKLLEFGDSKEDGEDNHSLEAPVSNDTEGHNDDPAANRY